MVIPENSPSIRFSAFRLRTQCAGGRLNCEIPYAPAVPGATKMNLAILGKIVLLFAIWDISNCDRSDTFRRLVRMESPMCSITKPKEDALFAIDYQFTYIRCAVMCAKRENCSAIQITKISNETKACNLYVDLRAGVTVKNLIPCQLYSLGSKNLID